MRILIAKDDSILADGLSRSLRHNGYAVDAVRDGPTADSALAAQPFDLLILDLGLPQLTGLEVLRRLRARNLLLPVLILTAADSLEQRVKGLDLSLERNRGAAASTPSPAEPAASEAVNHETLEALRSGAKGPSFAPPQRSLLGEILDWMLAPLFLLWPMSVAITYVVAQNIANAPYDRALANNLHVLSHQVQAEDGRVVLHMSNAAREVLRTDETNSAFWLASPGRVMCSTPTTACATSISAWPIPGSTSTCRARSPPCSSWPRPAKSAPSWPTTSSRA